MQRVFLLLISVFTLFAAIIWYRHIHAPVQESITYFPIHPDLSFQSVGTELKPEKNEHIHIRSFSRMEKPVFLRQDITMVFSEGRLVAKMGKWDQNVISLEQKQHVPIQENTKLQALSFHHAEIHENSAIKSTHTISTDYLYYLDRDETFKKPATETERIWQDLLDKEESRKITRALETITATYALNLDHFDIVPLTNLPRYEREPFPGFSSAETKVIIGQLIEGLYKNYFLGIKKEDGTTVSPLDSTVPVILIAKNREFLYVAFLTADGDAVLLKQNISD